MFFLENKRMTQKKSSFKPGNSCIIQLLSITQEIYQYSDDGFEVKSVFEIYLKPSIKFDIKGLFSNYD